MMSVSRIPIFACLAAIGTAGAVQPAAATDWQQNYLEPAVGAWMGVVTLLADGGEKQCKGECKGRSAEDKKARDGGRRGGKAEGRHRGHDGDHGRMSGPHGPEGHRRDRMHSPGRPPHGRMEPPRPEGPRRDALAMLNDIVGRLSRIERMLAARGPGMPDGPGGPRRGEWQGGRRAMPQVSPERRDAMRARMKEAREKWENASEEERAEMKKAWEARMKAGRERMREPRPRMEEARERFQAMQQRIERLEAELARMKKAAERDD